MVAMAQKVQKEFGDVICEFFNLKIVSNKNYYPTDIEFSLGADTQ